MTQLKKGSKITSISSFFLVPKIPRRIHRKHRKITNPENNPQILSPQTDNILLIEQNPPQKLEKEDLGHDHEYKVWIFRDSKGVKSVLYCPGKKPKTVAADGGGVTAKQNFRKRKGINWVFAAPSSPPSSSSFFFLSLSLCFLRNQLRVNVCFRIYKKILSNLFIYFSFLFWTLPWHIRRSRSSLSV